MLYDAQLSQKMASELLKVGIYVIGFYFPVVPKDQARMRAAVRDTYTRKSRFTSAFIKLVKDLK